MWFIAAVAGLSLIYGPFTALRKDPRSWTMAEKILYNSTRHLVWGLLLAWVTYACEFGYGGGCNQLRNKKSLASQRITPLAQRDYDRQNIKGLKNNWDFRSKPPSSPHLVRWQLHAPFFNFFLRYRDIPSVVGYVHEFLSSRFWIPLGRLTYCTYLVHCQLLQVMYAGYRSGLFFSTHWWVSTCRRILLYLGKYTHMQIKT